MSGINKEICGKCGKEIGRSEQAYVFDGKINCGECDAKIRNNETASKKKTPKAVIGMVLVIAATGAALFLYFNFQGSKIKLDTRETALGNSPRNLEDIVVSGDGKRIGIIVRDRADTKMKLEVDGIEGKEYDSIWGTAFDENKIFQFSPDSQRYMYKARRGRKHLVIVDGIEQKEYDNVDELTFSPDSKRIAYKAKTGEMWRVIVDDAEGDLYPYIRDIVFNPESDKLVYLVGIEKGIMSIVVDGKKGKEYRGVGRPAFLASTGQVVYPAINKNKWMMIVGDVEGKEYDNVGEGDPTLSPDGKRLAYAAKRGDKWLMVIDGIESEEFERIGGAVFSPDSNRVMFAAMNNNKHCVTIDGKTGNGHDAVDALTFSPDSKRTAYAAKQGTKWLITLDGIEQKLCDGITDLAFSPDSSHFAYLAHRDEKGFLVMDGVEQGKYDGVHLLTFSPDGKCVAFCANTGRKEVKLEEDDYEMRRMPGRITGKDMFGIPTFEKDKEEKFPNARGMKKMNEASGKLLVVVNDKRERQYDTVANLVFGPDSKTYVYWALAEEGWIIVVNGAEGRKYDGLLSGPMEGRHEDRFRYYLAGKSVSYPGSRFVFDTPTIFHTLARRDNKIFRVDIQIKK